jgi:hypothetical protein
LIYKKIGNKLAKRMRKDPLLFRLEKKPLLSSFIEQHNARKLNTEEFYRQVFSDFRKAKKEIIIYSPKIQPRQMKTALTYMQLAISRGTKVEIHTLNPAAKSVKRKRLQQMAINELTRIGRGNSWKKPVGYPEEVPMNTQVIIYLRSKMHENAVLIDKEIIYMGSLNVLSSSSNTSDLMLRYENPNVTRNFLIFLTTLEEAAERKEFRTLSLADVAFYLR